jgi:hypothetical protein
VTLWGKGELGGREGGGRARKAGLLALLAGAALALSGCWGTYVNVPGPPGGQGSYIVTIHQKNTQETIFACQANHPNSELARAKCGLGVVRLACNEYMLPGWDMNRCLAATDYTRNDSCNRVPGGPENCAESMKRAIEDVLENDRECVAYEYQAFVGDSYGWYGADDTGPYCP